MNIQELAKRVRVDRARKEAEKNLNDTRDACGGPSGPRDGCHDNSGYGWSYCHRHKHLEIEEQHLVTATPPLDIDRLRDAIIAIADGKLDV